MPQKIISVRLSTECIAENLSSFV